MVLLNKLVLNTFSNKKVLIKYYSLTLFFEEIANKKIYSRGLRGFSIKITHFAFKMLLNYCTSHLAIDLPLNS